MARAMMAAHDADGGDQSVETRVLRLYREHGRGLYGFALGMLGERADAEDVVHDGFVRLSSHLGNGGDDRDLKAWLYRVVLNRARDVLRERGRRGGEPPPAAMASGAPAALERGALEQVFQSLAPRDRSWC